MELTCYCYGPYPIRPHTPGCPDCEATILRDELRQYGETVSLETAVEWVSEWGRWELALQEYGRELNAPHPSLSAWERNR